MAQKNRKIHKHLGTQNCGYGCGKKHRGAGSRGGRGNAGGGKHKHIKMLIEGTGFGSVGFSRHASLQHRPTIINLSEIDLRIDSWVAEGKAKKTSGGYSIDMSDVGYGKVLGTGSLTRKIEVKADSFSKLAKEKIAKAGGKAVGGDDVDTV